MPACLYEKKKHIAYITLNRPEVMNAFNQELVEEFNQACLDFKEDRDLRVAIITGAGDKAFAAGADLKKTMPPVVEAEDGKLILDPALSVAATFFEPGWLPHQRVSMQRGLEIWKPFIAAINGYCLAGGMELVLACDIRICSETAVFGLPEVAIASVSVQGGAQRLLYAVPMAVAMKLLLTGERINAQEALRWGLVTDVVPFSELMPTAEKIARRIADNGPLAVMATKMSIIKAIGMPLDEGMLLGRLLFGMVRDTKDRIEGRRAFAEKRKPEFKGM